MIQIPLVKYWCIFSNKIEEVAIMLEYIVLNASSCDLIIQTVKSMQEHRIYLNK